MEIAPETPSPAAATDKTGKFCSENKNPVLGRKFAHLVPFSAQTAKCANFFMVPWVLAKLAHELIKGTSWCPTGALRLGVVPLGWGGLWASVGFRGLPWASVGFRGVPWGSMWFCRVP